MAKPCLRPLISSANLWKCAVVTLDSSRPARREDGNDRRLEWIPIPNDTSTRPAYVAREEGVPIAVMVAVCCWSGFTTRYFQLFLRYLR
jgi:hypothetical protein